MRERSLRHHRCRSSRAHADSSAPRLLTLPRFRFDLVLGLFVLFSVACSPNDTGGAATEITGTTDGTPRQKTAAVTLVEIGKLRIGQIRVEIDNVTNVEADHRIDVYPKVGPAYIKEVLVEEGDAVKTGQALLTLIDVDFALEVRRRDSLWRQRKQSELHAATVEKESRARARAQEASLAKAQADFQRSIDAQNGGIEVLSEKELQDAQSEFDRQRAELDAMNVGIERAAAEVELAKITTQSAKIELEAAEKDLRDTVIYAPIDGVIQRRDVNAGLLVNSGTHLFTLVDPSRLRANLSIPEQSLAAVSKIGLPVEIECIALRDRKFIGHIEAINPAIDPTNGQIRVRARLPDDAIGVVKPGMMVKAKIVVESRDDAVLVRKRAVLFEGGKTYLFVHDQGKAKRFRFEAGPDTADSEEVEVISIDGQKPDLSLEIIQVGQDRLRDGDPVTVVENDR